VIRVPPGSVILDPAEVDYVARALEHFAEVLAARRDERGQPTPSAPSPKLVALTAKLRRATGDSTEPGSAIASAGYLLQPSQPPVPAASARDSQQDSMHAGPHDDIGTAEAARRLGITSNGVRDLARRGRLEVRRAGHRWLVTAASVDAHARRQAALQGR
jgi:excisionase family DNA binding protein